MTEGRSDLRVRYGPWAVITGASEGVGESFVRLLAASGVNVVLVARRADVLDRLARDLAAETGVETRVVALDLALPDAASTLLDAIADLEIGLLIVAAGAADGALFLDEPLEAWMSLTHRNVMVTLELCHRLAGPMRERRRGGLLLVGSGAGRVGAAQIAVYSGTKAFERNLAEGLWWELRDFGVDVLALALRGTATPAMLRRLDAKGITLEGLDDPADVARLGLARLGAGPEYAVHEEDGWIEDWWSADSRRRQVEEASERAAAYFERRPPA